VGSVNFSFFFFFGVVCIDISLGAIWLGHDFGSLRLGTLGTLRRWPIDDHHVPLIQQTKMVDCLPNSVLNYYVHTYYDNNRDRMITPI
jgi:hypothetical protein